MHFASACALGSNVEVLIIILEGYMYVYIQYVFLPLPITHALTDTMSLKDSIRLGFVLVYSAERPASLAVIK